MNTDRKESQFAIIGKIMREAIQNKKDAPGKAVLLYMKENLEDAKEFNYEPNWGKIKRDIKKIWWENI